MNHFILLLFITISLFAQEQTFKLQDGTIIVGSIQEETEITYIIQTKYGSVTLNKGELVQTAYEIKLTSGETFSGIKLSETDISIQLKTKVGVLNIDKSDISDMKESGQVTPAGGKSTGAITSSRRSYSLVDMLFGTGTRGAPEKNIEFAMGEERLTDSFFDPTAYVLDNGTLYLSGLSFAFGLSDKLHISSRWVDFFWGNFNIRPKYMLFHKGNWEKESALAIGGHFHTYWMPNKVVWQEGNVDITKNSWENGANVSSTTNYNYGGYFPLGAKITGSNDGCWEDGCGDHLLDVEETEDLDFMIEIFSAYTFSKARKGMKGRISNTVGALVQMPMKNGYEWPYRIFGSVDVDLTRKLKMVGEVFYDPFFLDLYQRTDFEGPFTPHHAYKVDATNSITKENFNNIRPIHFDFGFIYAVNENFRFGIHNQIPIITFYWKF